ncbi:hypothetical protein H4W79_002800 [Nocardiopsis terrae]|uniref:Uncharacterized protein n=1 Tax=Nocardiopsis terrae TaxID=372655 RepID=A0ABR9HHT0_9ACTN|nr:hypothetical protein [Nocardiopsis terrae]
MNRSLPRRNEALTPYKEPPTGRPCHLEFQLSPAFDTRPPARAPPAREPSYFKT